jgi:group I intron endonuclease
MKEYISGIYKITNLINNKIYIGSAKKCEVRKKQHENIFNNSMAISRAICKYGWENFSFEIIETCEIKDLLIREQYWIDLYRSYDELIGYNIAKSTTAFARGLKHSEESKRKMSELCKRRFSDPKEREKLRNRNLGEKNPLYGKKHSDESRRKMSEAAKLRYKNMRAPFSGKSHSIESINKIREAKKKRDLKNPKPVAQIDLITGKIIKIWDYIFEAAEEIYGNRKKACNIRNAAKHNGIGLGFRWKYV